MSSLLRRRSSRSILATVLAFSIIALTLAFGPAPQALAAQGQVYLPNITKTLGGPSGWTTPIVVQNTGAAVSDVTLTFFRFSDGKQIATVTLPGVKPGQSVTFDPRTNATLPNDTQFATVVQSTSGQVAVTVIEGSGSSWMAYSGTTTGGSTVYLPNITRNLGGRNGWNTPFVVQNLGTAATKATVTFYNFRDGSVAKKIENVALEPGRSQAFLTWAIDGLPDDAQFAVVVQGPADSQLFAIVNEVSGPMAMSYEGLLTGSEVVYLPNVLKYVGGSDHWSTPFVVQNIGATATSFNIEFYSFDTGRLVTTMPGTLQPGRSLPVDVRFTPVQLPAGSYSVVVRGQAGAKLGAVVNEVEIAAGMAMSYDGIPQSLAQQSVYLPLLRKNVGDVKWFSPIIAQNLGSTPTDMTLTLYNAAGVVAVQKTFPDVKPGAAAVYDPRFDRRLQDGTYSAVLQSTNAIAAIVNQVAVASGDYAMAFNGTAGPAVEIPSTGLSTKQVGAYTFALKQSASADLWVDTSIDPATASRAVAQAEADVHQLESDYGRSFRVIPAIYLFGSTESYAAGLQVLLGNTPERAASMAKNTEALFSPQAQIVLANWGMVSKTQPQSAIRHELTHFMNSQVIGTNPTMPAWLDEGLAVNSELTLPNSRWLTMLMTYRTASMAATGTLIPLTDLESPILWGSRTGTASTYQYAEAQQAVAMLRADVGQAGLNRILSLMGQGQSFRDAYATVAGRPYSDFVEEFPARAKALAPKTPAIATAEDSPLGPGLSYIYYGFTPVTPVTLEIRTNTIGGVYLEITDRFGAQWGYLGPNFPTGAYSLTVNDGLRIITAVARKT